MTDTDLLQRIDALVDQHRDDIVSGLCDLLKFRTVSGGGTPEAEAEFIEETAKCLEFLEAQAAKMGLEWRNHSNQCAVIQLGEHEKFIGLPVHVDVVPVGDGWTHGPFDGTVADGVIFGRGCQDDKGPVIQTLWGVYLLKLLGMPLKRGARVIVGTKEECGDWADIKHYFEVEPEPEFSIVSDAEFPIINGEKGMMNVRVAGSLPVDLEPAVGGWRFKSATAGQRANIVPEFADLKFAGDDDAEPAQVEAELKRFLASHPGTKATISATGAGHMVIKFEGKSAHGSLPHLGHNAALDLLLYITESGFVTDDEADTAGFLHEIGSDLTGARLDIARSHDFIGPTTVNLGILDWQGGEVRATLNIRNTMGLTNDEVETNVSRHVAEFADETGFEFAAATAGRAVNPIYVDPAHHPEFISALQETYKAVTGREPKLMAIGGTTYAKAFPRAVCFGPVDPADGEEELAHQVNERVSVEHHLRNVRMYAYALARLCAG